MRYYAQSAIIGRSGKRDEYGNGPVFIHLFDINDPHKTNKVPNEFVDFEKIHKIVFTSLNVNFLLAGSDILINNLKYLDIEEESSKKGNLLITGKQD